jgi:hypothetical protein
VLAAPHPALSGRPTGEPDRLPQPERVPQDDREDGANQQSVSALQADPGNAEVNVAPMPGSKCRNCQGLILGVRSCLRCGAPRPWHGRGWLFAALSMGLIASLFAAAARSSGAPLFRDGAGVRHMSGPSFEPDDYDERRAGS